MVIQHYLAKTNLVGTIRHWASTRWCQSPPQPAASPGRNLNSDLKTKLDPRLTRIGPRAEFEETTLFVKWEPIRVYTDVTALIMVPNIPISTM